MPIKKSSDSSEALIQRKYYAETAGRYDEMHVAADDEHHTSLLYISALLRQLRAQNVLDVGCGTGRAIEYIAQNNPEVFINGIEPVPQLLNVAAKKGIARARLVNGSGVELPYKSGSFDVVVECGVLHHVREPESVVDEMMRVARKAVFLSDSNIFGQGRPALRPIKLALYRTGLWKLAKLVQTGGKGYRTSEHDGLSYSYSVYFQHSRLIQWAQTVFAIPVSRHGMSRSWWSPVLTADTVLLCALRD
jgi:ubiquinone/menaquinone biosynthesis C-methylase UbiE